MVTRSSRQTGSKRPSSRAAKRGGDVWDKIFARARSIPAEDLEGYPPDGAINLDHYLYGAKKQYPRGKR